MAIRGFNGPNRFLSNFYAVEFDFEGMSWPSAEHAYQAMKTLDGNLRERIQALDTPGKAKRLGKSIQLRNNWENIKRDKMLQILRAKFAEGTLMAAKLLATEDEQLIEENYWGDTYWGVCRGVGENHLGRILMLVRAELRDKK